MYKIGGCYTAIPYSEYSIYYTYGNSLDEKKKKQIPLVCNKRISQFSHTHSREEKRTKKNRKKNIKIEPNLNLLDILYLCALIEAYRIHN